MAKCFYYYTVTPEEDFVVSAFILLFYPDVIIFPQVYWRKNTNCHRGPCEIAALALPWEDMNKFLFTAGRDMLTPLHIFTMTFH